MTTLTRRHFTAACLGAGASTLLGTLSSRAEASPGATYTNFASLGGVPNNAGFDNASVLNTAISQGIRNLYIPAGNWTFLTKPTAISHPMEIVGEGFSSTTLIRRYTEFTSTNGLLSFRAGNQHILRLGVLAAAGTGGGAGISFYGDNTGSPDFSVVEDVYVSQEPGSNGTWQDSILIHGTQRNNNGLIGVRDISLRNCQLFAATNSSCQIKGGVAINILGGGMFPAGGTTGRLQITGTSSVASYYVSADVPYIGGLYLDHCNFVNVKAAVIAGNITNASTASDVFVLGRCTGTVNGFWTRGRHADPGIPGS